MLYTYRLININKHTYCSRTSRHSAAAFIQIDATRGVIIPNIHILHSHARASEAGMGDASPAVRRGRPPDSIRCCCCCSPWARLGSRAIAPEGLLVAEVACGQGHDDVGVSHRLWRRVDWAQKAKTGPRQARAPQAARVPASPPPLYRRGSERLGSPRRCSQHRCRLAGVQCGAGMTPLVPSDRRAAGGRSLRRHGRRLGRAQVFGHPWWPWRNSLASHSSHCRTVARRTAPSSVLRSVGTSSWGRAEASPARASARSLPGRPQWDGTHCRWTERFSSCRASRAAAPRGVPCAAGPFDRSRRAAWESVQTMMLLVVPGMSVTVRRAASSAVSSALVLLHTLPAATRTSRFSPEGSWIRAPPPPRATPASAEPSVHTQTASSGRVARCSSAAARRTVSGAPLPPAIPASKQEMPAVEVHGGRVIHRRGSMGTPATSAAASASRPAVLHPVTLESREGARASPTALRGSPGGREAARPSILVASARCWTPAGSIPASAIRASTGVDAGQPVTTRATARSSRSTDSRCVGEAAGIHAAAQYSSAPLT